MAPKRQNSAAREKLRIDAAGMPLDEWLAIVVTPERDRTVSLTDYQFPTQAHRDQFLESAQSYPEKTVRALLRSFLIDAGTLGSDERVRQAAYSLPSDELWKLTEESEFISRLVHYPFVPWQGITWILDLLPHRPSRALDALAAYFSAHGEFLPDGRANGLADVEAIVRKRYLQRENPRDALLALKPDEFEYLVAALYEKLGYVVTVTAGSRDGGVDIEAARRDAGGQALVFVQCKRYDGVVRVHAVRELMGVVSRRQANKGVIVATSGFTGSARREAGETPMIELIDFPALNRLLNKHIGPNWPDRMSYDIRRMQAAAAKAQNVHSV